MRPPATASEAKDKHDDTATRLHLHRPGPHGPRRAAAAGPQDDDAGPHELRARALRGPGAHRRRGPAGRRGKRAAEPGAGSVGLMATHGGDGRGVARGPAGAARRPLCDRLGAGLPDPAPADLGVAATSRRRRRPARPAGSGAGRLRVPLVDRAQAAPSTGDARPGRRPPHLAHRPAHLPISADVPGAARAGRRSVLGRRATPPRPLGGPRQVQPVDDAVRPGRRGASGHGRSVHPPAGVLPDGAHLRRVLPADPPAGVPAPAGRLRPDVVLPHARGTRQRGLAGRRGRPPGGPQRSRVRAQGAGGRGSGGARGGRRGRRGRGAQRR